MPRMPKVEFDMLQLYVGEPYVIDLDNAYGSITVYSPTIGDIIHIGEKRFYETLNIFVCNTTQYRVVLWDLGRDWNETSDFELFCMLYKQIDKEVSKMMFGDVDFSKFEPMIKTLPPDEETGEEKSEVILWDEEDEIEINADVHNHFSQYLREVFGLKIDEKITHNQTLKKWYIDKDKREIARKLEKAQKGEIEKSSIQSIISSCINHPGFKYKLKELRELGVAEFYDSVKRLQIYEQSTALMKGMYSGFVDGSKIKPQDYNFMREI